MLTEVTQRLLWFDVENERYTTIQVDAPVLVKLWFDVENERYTTFFLSIK